MLEFQAVNCFYGEAQVLRDFALKLEAGEILGMSKRQFRRYRVRFEEEGLAGLADRRLGKPSARRVPRG